MPLLLSTTLTLSPSPSHLHTSHLSYMNQAFIKFLGNTFYSKCTQVCVCVCVVLKAAKKKKNLKYSKNIFPYPKLQSWLCSEVSSISKTSHCVNGYIYFFWFWVCLFWGVIWGCPRLTFGSRLRNHSLCSWDLTGYQKFLTQVYHVISKYLICYIFCSSPREVHYWFWVKQSTDK